MNCPNCNAPKMGVIASRDTEENMYRHRKCVSCGQRVTTIEMYSAENLDAPMPPHRPNRIKKEQP